MTQSTLQFFRPQVVPCVFANLLNELPLHISPPNHYPSHLNQLLLFFRGGVANCYCNIQLSKYCWTTSSLPLLFVNRVVGMGRSREIENRRGIWMKKGSEDKMLGCECDEQGACCSSGLGGKGVVLPNKVAHPASRISQYLAKCSHALATTTHLRKPPKRKIHSILAGTSHFTN